MTTCPLPLPLKGKVLGAEYDSRLIHKHRLYSVETMLKTNRYLVTKHNSPATLAQRLARRAVFGDDCLIQCTPLGSSIYLALPQKELFNLKKNIFSLYPHLWSKPGEFELVWLKCRTAIEQACWRLRRK